MSTSPISQSTDWCPALSEVYCPSKLDACAIVTTAAVYTLSVVTFGLFPLIAFALCALHDWIWNADIADEPYVQLEVSPEVISRVQSVLESFIANEEVEGMRIYKSNGTVFELKEFPGFIFKTSSQHSLTRDGSRTNVNGVFMSSNEALTNRLKKTQEAAALQKTHSLSLLYFPQVALFTCTLKGREVNVICEEKIEGDTVAKGQEKQFRDHASTLVEAVKQLVTYISATGWDDVELRNMAVMEGCKIALLDIESQGDARVGVYGSAYKKRSGLVNCLPKGLLQVAIAEANRLGVEAPDNPDEIIETACSREDYYTKQGLYECPTRPLDVDFETLGLNLDQKEAFSWYNCGEVGIFTEVEYRQIRGLMINAGKSEEDVRKELGVTEESHKESISLRDYVERVVDKINEKIQSSKENCPTRHQRCLILERSAIFNHQGELGVRNDIASKFTLSDREVNEIRETSWFHQTIKALLDKGYILEASRYSSEAYTIQA